MEPWHEWCKRVTEEVAKEILTAGIEELAVAAKRKVWTLAGHISRRDDGRWSKTMISWQPEAGQSPVARPFKRWVEDINKFVQLVEPNEEPEAWRLLAAHRPTWKALGDAFCGGLRQS